LPIGDLEEQLVDELANVVETSWIALPDHQVGRDREIAFVCEPPGDVADMFVQTKRFA